MNTSLNARTSHTDSHTLIDFSGTVITHISRAVCVTLAESYTRKIKDRPTQGLIITSDGKVAYTHMGKTYISGSMHPLLITEGISYSFVSLNQSRSIIFNFETAEPLPFTGIFAAEGNLNAKASLLENQWTFHKTGCVLNIMSFIYSFLAKQTQNMHSYCPSASQHKIDASIEYIEKHYTDPALNLKTIASQSDISLIYFRKLFVKIYGMSPMHYVQQIRIERAKKLLTSDLAMSISEVADACGFSSVYYFSKAFHQTAGVSASRYRSSHYK